MTETKKRSGLEGCLAIMGRGVVLRFAVAAYVIGVLAVSLLCGMVMLPILGADTDIAFLISFLGGIGLAIGGAMVAVVIYVVRRNRNLDAAFEIAGLEGKAYLSGGRQFHGQFNGRQVEVYLTHGPSLALHVPVNLQTETAMGTRTGVGQGLNRAFNRESMSLDDPIYTNIMVFPRDETWTRRLLAEPAARAAIDALMNYDSNEIRNLHIRPNELSLRLHRLHLGLIKEENVHQWLAALIELAEAAEAQPEPEIKVAPSTTAQRIRRSRINSPVMIWGIALGTVFLVLLCSLLIVVPIIFLDS